MTDNSLIFLHPDHRVDLRKSGLLDETILEAGIKSVRPGDIDKIFGYDPLAKSCYEIPYSDEYSRYRMFYNEADRINQKTGEERPKYLARKGSGNRLYIPHKARPFLQDLSTPLYITEGEKKALKATQEGIPCIAISGLWNWSNGETELIQDFALIALNGRIIHIVPDSGWQNPDRKGERKNLKQAVYELAYKLIDKGAKVSWVELPQGDTEAKLDDYLCNHSVEDFKKLPIHSIRKLTIDEAISNADKQTPIDEIQEVLKRIAQVTSNSERAKYINDLSEKTGIPKKAIREDIERFARNDKPEQGIADSNFILTHPSLEVNQDFLNIGFRETVITDGVLKDKNFYLVTRENKYEVCNENIFHSQDFKVLFDTRDRVLISINDRWCRKRLYEFVDNPAIPERLYQEIKQTLKQYIEFQKEACYGLLTAWTMATYFHRCFNAMPFLFFYGKKGCGKSRGLDLLERLCFNAIKIKGVTVASLADSIDGVRATMLIDQAESLSDPKNADILGLLADSYTIGGGKRRIVHISNKTRRVMEFETYSPKAFAAIKDIDTDLKDRCILTPMIRAAKEYPYPEAHLPVWKDLRDKLYRLLLTRWASVAEIYKGTGEGMSHRVRELWRPIETVLRLENVSPDEAEEIRAVFLDAMKETQTELSDWELDLFETLLFMLKEKKEDVFTASEIAKLMTCDKGDVTEKSFTIWIGKALGQFSLYSEKAGRKNKQRAYRFNYETVENIFSRYHQTNGFYGSMVKHEENQGLQGDHSGKALWSSYGNQWSNGHLENKKTTNNALDTIEKPLNTIEIPYKTIGQNSYGQGLSAVNKGLKKHDTIEPLKTADEENKKISTDVMDLTNISESELMEIE